MRHKLLASFLTLASLFIAAVGFSYPYEDHAGNAPYTDGWDLADNGNSGSSFYSGWNFSTFTDASALAVDATSVGGSSLLNTGGRAWVMSTNRADTTNSSSAVTRSTGFITPDSTVVQVDLQMINLGFYSEVMFYTFSGHCLFLNCGTVNGHSNWSISDGGGITNTGIPVTTPIRVQYLDGAVSADYTLKIYQLSNGAVLYNSPRTSTSSTYVNQIQFSQIDNGVSGLDSHFILNNLIFDTGGTLPVELDFFMVE